MNFSLKKTSAGKSVVSYQVVDAKGDVRGSVNVAPEDEADFLRHWNGATDQPTTAREARAAAKRTPGIDAPGVDVRKVAAALKRPLSKEAIARMLSEADGRRGRPRRDDLDGGFRGRRTVSGD